MLTPEAPSKKNNYFDTKLNYQNYSPSIFNATLRLAREGKINESELEVLLSFYAAKYIEKKFENKISKFISYECRKFFEKRFLND